LLRCVALLGRLRELHAERLDTFRVCLLHAHPLFDSLAECSTADVLDMQRLCNYLQLPKELNSALEQHAAAEQYRRVLGDHRAEVAAAAAEAAAQAAAKAAAPPSMWQRGGALIVGILAALSLGSPPSPAALPQPTPTLAAHLRSSRELRPLLNAACNLCTACLGDLLRDVLEGVAFPAGLCGGASPQELFFGQQPRFFSPQSVVHDVAGRVATGHPMQHSPEAIYCAKMYNLPCILLAGLGRLQELNAAMADGWSCHELACHAAAKHGHTAVLQWLHEEAHMEQARRDRGAAGGGRRLA
jgi:hypothetical protein